MTTAAPSTALATIQPAFTGAAHLGVQFHARSMIGLDDPVRPRHR